MELPDILPVSWVRV